MQHYAVIGLGNFGSTLAIELQKIGHDVIAIDGDSEKAQLLRDYLAHVVVADATDRETLEALGVGDVECVVISLGHNLEASVLATLHCAELGVPRIYAKVVSRSQGRILERVGATRVVFPEREVARRLAHKLSSPNLIDFLPITEGYSVEQVRTPAAFVGKSLGELQLPKRFRVQIIAIRESAAPGSPLHLPTADTALGADDQLVLLGRNEDLAALAEIS
ncbi:MAG: potassium channel family protein [Acidobacteriota bacterium]